MTARFGNVWRLAACTAVFLAGASHAAETAAGKPSPAAAAKPSIEPAKPVADPVDLLRLANGGVSHGRLRSLSGSGAEARLCWKPEQAFGSVEFPTAGVVAVELGRRAAGTVVHAGSALLANGDLLPGDVVSMDDKCLRLDTWYAGPLSIPRSVLQGAVLAVPREADAVLYDSRRDGMKGWLLPDGKKPGSLWSCSKEGAICSNSYESIVWGDGLPECARVDLDIPRKLAGDMEIAFFYDLEKGRKNGDMFPTMQIDSSWTRIIFRIPDPRGYRSGDSMDIPPDLLRGGEDIRVSLLTDHLSGMMMVLLNGRLFSVRMSSAGSTLGKTFKMRLSSGRVSRVRAGKWDGLFASRRAEPVRLSKDAVLLDDGDRMRGTLLDLSKDKLRLTTAFAGKPKKPTPLEFPRERVAQLFFAQETPAAPPATVPGAVCCLLDEAGIACVTVAPESLADGVLKGGTAFGGVALQLAALTKLEWPAAAQPKVKGARRTATADVVELANGDSLPGTLASLGGGAETRLGWKPAGAEGLAEFALDAVSKIQLHGRPQAAPAAAGRRDYVCLANGDMLAGRLVSLDARELVLDTDFAGKLTIPRTALCRVLPGSASSGALYAGPTGMEGWGVTGSGDEKVDVPAFWGCSDGILFAKQDGAVLGREISGLPDGACFDFDLAWDSCSQLTFAFFADKVPQNDYGYTGYSLDIPLGQRSVTLYRREMNGSSGSGNSADYTLPSDAKKTHVTVKANRKRGDVTLFLDGHKVSEFTGFSGNSTKGTAMAFRGIAEGVEISNIRVTPWDESGAAAPNAGSTSDSVRFVNGDSMAGRFVLPAASSKGTLEGKLVAPMVIPLERVAEISMKPEPPVPLTVPAVRVILAAAAGSLVLEKAVLADGVLKGVGSGCGEVKIPMSQIQRLAVVRPPSASAEKPAGVKKGETRAPGKRQARNALRD